MMNFKHEKQDESMILRQNPENPGCLPPILRGIHKRVPLHGYSLLIEVNEFEFCIKREFGDPLGPGQL
ncbi:hypothetical protein Lepto7375DRAFT_5298 [Leptolyngbya sp. PCC 7375]|nr:hypothetical protein Lepto7375DRAFT_5298 [Leptolyngbya sp. PCC 7375]